jgi:hypothetical protein
MFPRGLQAAAWVPLIWLALVVVGSALVRRSRRKPVFFFSVANAIFQEHRASGCSTDSWWRRLGGARNCLVVAVTPERLIIRPHFPFNLMFLPEIYGLEFDVPRASVTEVIADHSFLRRRVRIAFRDEDQTLRTMSLFLKRPDAFLGLFGKS